MDTAFTKQADADAREAVSWVHNSNFLLSFLDGIGFLALKTGIISLLALAAILLALLYKHPLHIEEGFSFPSRHAMVGVIFYGFLIYLLAGKIASAAVRRWLYAAVGILMLLIGMSRVVTNAHFLSDVISGYFIGLICLIFVIADYEKLNEFLSAARSKKSGVSV
ncbi:phosphatase PAP2 family protein [Bacillus sp. F19]|nr:phosphatase PAP2 family protein [Bacillus sp. F19]